MAGAVEQIVTSHNKRFSEMAVGVETGRLLHPSTSVTAQGMAHPVRDFAKPPGVKRKFRYAPFPFNGEPLTRLARLVPLRGTSPN